MTLSNRLQELTPEFTAIRRDFHRHPELGHCEWETSRKICRYLTDWGYEVHDNIASTGVVARLKKGSSKKCICIRADMDALPIAEANHFAHASAVVQRDPRRPTESVTNDILHSHICAKLRTVIDVARFTERRVGSRHVVMVAA